MNRLANCRNEFQGEALRVLCVCSAGLLRSPTAAVVLASSPYEYNTRAVGLTAEFALISIDAVLIAWADLIVCMSEEQAIAVRPFAKEMTEVISLDIPDQYAYRDPKLMHLIAERFNERWYNVDRGYNTVGV